MKPVFWAACFAAVLLAAPARADDTEKRRAFLRQLLATLPPDPHWNEWLFRTGELPPDFDSLPTMMELPDPLLLEENGRQIPITTKAQWTRKRAILKALFERYVTGRFPPAPGNVEASVLKETRDTA